MMTRWAHFSFLGLLLAGCGGLDGPSGDDSDTTDSDVDTDDTDPGADTDTDTDHVPADEPLPDGVSETCEGADAEGVLETGVWTFEVEAVGRADHESECMGGSGPEHVFKIRMQEGEQLLVTLDSPGDGVIYLTESCGNLNTCVAAVDETVGPGVEELAWHYRDDSSSQPFTGYLFLDTYWPSDELGPYTATIEIAPRPLGLFPYDTCAEAMAGIPSSSGSYTLDTTPFTNQLNAGSPGPSCTGYSTNGNDAIVRIELRPGETLFASWASNADSAVYILTDCNDTTTCVDGDDSGDPEMVSHTNNTGALQVVYLVLDTWSSFSTFGDVEIDIY